MHAFLRFRLRCGQRTAPPFPQ